MTEEVLYEEVDGIAIVAINRPEKKNTLTDKVVHGIADVVDAASRSKEVAAVVLRGAGDIFTAGYDLTGGGEVGRALRRSGHRSSRRCVGPGEGPRLHGQQRQALHADLGVPEIGAG